MEANQRHSERSFSGQINSINIDGSWNDEKSKPKKHAHKMMRALECECLCVCVYAACTLTNYTINWWHSCRGDMASIGSKALAAVVVFTLKFIRRYTLWCDDCGIPFKGEQRDRATRRERHLCGRKKCITIWWFTNIWCYAPIFYRTILISILIIVSSHFSAHNIKYVPFAANE